MENKADNRIDDRDDIRGKSCELADFLIQQDPDLLEMYGSRDEIIEMVDATIDGDNQPLIILLSSVSNGFRINHEKCMEWLWLMHADRDTLERLIDPDLTGYQLDVPHNTALVWVLRIYRTDGTVETRYFTSHDSCLFEAVGYEGQPGIRKAEVINGDTGEVLHTIPGGKHW